ncbi:unnamed protein product [Ranitomeya imitator]|uniref:Nucleoside-diphosphate kinase n=1 Tax=Ranitomeya imitator TaxID=111125 RepID=A0ABN9LP66_9NEOB|nr:unnamed protein product [Ranitomeya imitator]
MAEVSKILLWVEVTVPAISAVHIPGVDNFAAYFLSCKGLVAVEKVQGGWGASHSGSTGLAQEVLVRRGRQCSRRRLLEAPRQTGSSVPRADLPPEFSVARFNSMPVETAGLRVSRASNRVIQTMIRARKSSSQLHQDKMALPPLPSLLPKVVSAFYPNEDIVLPYICPAPSPPLERSLNRLDLIRAVRVYLARIAPFRKTDFIFVICEGACSGLLFSKATIGRWIRMAILELYQVKSRAPPSGIKAHSTWAVSASLAVHHRPSALQLCKAATLSSIHMFAKFYSVHTYASADGSLGATVPFKALISPNHQQANTESVASPYPLLRLRPNAGQPALSTRGPELRGCTEAPLLASEQPPLHHHSLADDARRRTIPLHFPVKRMVDQEFIILTLHRQKTAAIARDAFFLTCWMLPRFLPPGSLIGQSCPQAVLAPCYQCGIVFPLIQGHRSSLVSFGTSPQNGTGYPYSGRGECSEKCISAHLGPGKAQKVSKEMAFLNKELTQLDIDHLLVNLRMEAVFLKENFNIHWMSQSGIVENIESVIKEYKQSRGLLPVRICILGPPASGKTTVSKMLCKKYKLHHIHIKDVITEAIDKLERLVKSPPEEEEEEGEEEPEAWQELLDNVRENMEQNGGRLDDTYVIRFMREKLKSMPCQNQGYVLDGYPKTYEQAKELFRSEEGEEEEESRSKAPRFDPTITPDFVISLDASDEFLKDRVINLPESTVAGTHYSQDRFLRSLATFRDLNTEDETVLNYFDEAEITLCILQITKEVGEPRNYGLTPEESAELEKKQAEESLTREAERMAELTRLEAEEEAEKIARWEEWNSRLEEVKRQEHEMLEAQSVPLRNYLMKNVMPTLIEGLNECCKVRPDDPVDYLAEYLFKRNPQIE